MDVSPTSWFSRKAVRFAAAIAACLVVVWLVAAPAVAHADEYAGAQTSLQAAAKAKTSVSYRVHVDGVGWMDKVKNGAVTGKTGSGQGVSALRLKVSSKVPGSIAYRARIQGSGWTKWARNGANVGAAGKSLRLEALKIKLTGKLAKRFDVYYRVKVRGIGWLEYAKNGQAAGTRGCAMPIVGMRVKLKAKGEAAPKKTADRYRTLSYSYSTKVRGSGWTDFVGSRKISGAPGSGMNIYGFRMSLSTKGFTGSLKYKTFLKDVGWTSWVKDGKPTERVSEKPRVEAFRIKLTGELAEHFDVYYRAYVDTLGWLSWAKNGMPAGSRDHGLRAEAIQVTIVPKGASAPGPTDNPYRDFRKADKLRDKLWLSTDYHDEFVHGDKSARYQKYIVLHDTEGMGSPENTVLWWQVSGNLVAAHFVVGRDGHIVQCVPLDKIAHHAGYGNTGHNAVYGVSDESRDDKKGTQWVASFCADYGMNSYSVGIEMVHVGGGAAYTEEQLDALDDLIAYIDAYYGFESAIIDHKAWRTGNSDTSPEFAGYLANYQNHRTHW